MKAGGEAVRQQEGMPASLPCPTPRAGPGPSQPGTLARRCGASRAAAWQNQGSLAPGGDDPLPCSRRQHALACTGTGRLLSGAAARAAAWAPQPCPKLSKLKKKKPDPGCQSSAINQSAISLGRSRSLLPGSRPIALSWLPKILACRGH